MVFSSIEFLFYFLPVFLILYTFLPWKNVILALGSLIFYIWGEGFFVAIMIVSIVSNYFIGKLIAKSTPENKKSMLFLGLAVNMFILILYKYTGFIVYDMFSLDNFPEHLVPKLPLGISFFTCLLYTSPSPRDRG